MTRHLVPALLLPAVLLCAACQPSRPPMSRAQRADYDACRARADAVYNQQNRAAISERDTRDTPFATNYVSGITSNGLSARFARDNLVGACSPGQQPVDVGTGPAFGGPKAR